jgi:CBS domain-containing protein
MNVGSICVHHVETAAPSLSAHGAARRMTDARVGSLVVVDDHQRPLGIVTDRDVIDRCVARGEDPHEITLADLMSAPAVWVHESAAIEDALAEMARLRVRRLPVVNDRDCLVGILSLDDVLELLARELEAVARVVGVLPRGRGD